ncbi:MAG: redoxin [Acidobacteria bacterium]|nr:redoxin [Acidobacteriota bacterium]
MRNLRAPKSEFLSEKAMSPDPLASRRALARGTFLAILFALAAASVAPAQIIDPVKWSLALEPAAAAPGSKIVGKLTATVDDGWHLYASTTPQGKPIALQLDLAANPAIASWEAFQPEPARQFDELFGVESQWYEHGAEFRIEIQLSEAASGQIPIEAKLRYGACDAKTCLPPTRRSATATLTAAPGESAALPPRPAGYEAMQLFAAPPPPAETVAEAAAAMPSQPPAGQTAAADQGLFQFAAVAFGFGLLAIFTPCVFPMIPITMSYFVSTQSGEKKASLVQATTFVVGVIGLFTGLGALVSVVLGPFGMQQLGSNVWVNLFIAVVFFAFGASLLGAFEITVPSGALTKLNSFTQGSGLLPTLMMGLVFALASFACTGPFVGALLAGSVSGGGMAWPVFGMLMFSTGLALPFFFLALFPAYLNRLPRAGGWMTRVKIAMAFPIIAAAFKYLSNVDQMYHWELLSRDRFLAVWIGLFALDGLYLLGLLRLEDEPADKVGLGRLAVGAASLIFAVSLLPGMFGGHLGELEAYIPASSQGYGFASGDGAKKAAWIKDDYPAALEQAREQGRPLLISFTGYSCTNCKWMKANMFPKPRIAAALDRLVLLELYTDDPNEAVSEANQKLQQERFQSVAVPFYALVDADGRTISTFPGRTRDVDEFEQFLQSAKPMLSEARAGR